jgi:hypothetical protein
MQAESAACDFAVSSVAFLPPAKLCLIGTVNWFSLTGDRLYLRNTITVTTGAAICASPDRPRMIVAGNGTAALITVVGKELVFRGNAIVADLLRRLIVFDLKNSISDALQFAESIIDFHVNFNHLV